MNNNKNDECIAVDRTEGKRKEKRGPIRRHHRSINEPTEIPVASHVSLMNCDTIRWNKAKRPGAESINV